MCFNRFIVHVVKDGKSFSDCRRVFNICVFFSLGDVGFDAGADASIGYSKFETDAVVGWIEGETV